MKVKVAATQMSCSWELDQNILKAKNIIVQAAKKGANIILLQELFQSPIFASNTMRKSFTWPKPLKTTKYSKKCLNFVKN